MLRLMAAGHSIKTAAAEEGISEYAANELLRSSRRKLGTGSSREAARILASHERAQKSRDEISGIPLSRLHGRSPVHPSKGAIAMILAVLAASAVLILAMQGDDSRNRATAAGPAKVVRTYPAQGEEIEPGPFKLAVVFDRPMAPESYSFVQTDEGAYPECASKPRLSTDGRSYTLDCVARAGTRYVIYFNRPPYMAFRDAATGAMAAPARLEFTARR